MWAKSLTASVAAVAAVVDTVHAVSQHPLQADLETFIQEQGKISIAGVLANIGPDGSEADGVPPGVVVASPSRSEPDCKAISHTLSSFFEEGGMIAHWGMDLLTSLRLVYLDPRCRPNIQGVGRAVHCWRLVPTGQN